MNLVLFLSNFIIPFVIFYIVLYGMFSKVAVFDEFIKGAKEGFQTVIKIAPTLVGLLVAISVIRTSGTLDLLTNLLKPIGAMIRLPSEVIPVVIVKMFSASAANGLIFDLFKTYGTDSYIGLLASIIMSCTETLLYVMSVYLVSIGVKKSRYILPGALIATLAGVIASVIMAKWMMG